jgi:isopentenyldiphosphate isomerase
MIEYFPIVNEAGEVIGKESRSVCHNGSMLLHPVVHLHVFNSSGDLYLQKRNMNKDIQPGKWDTSVGGHVDYGEKVEDALLREVREEIGITDFKPLFAFRYKFTSTIETEFVNAYVTIYDKEIFPNDDELDGGKFWTKEEIENSLGKEIFTPNFEGEYTKLVAFLAENNIFKQ